MKKTIFLLLLILGAAILMNAESKSVPVRMKPSLLVIDIQNVYLPMMDEKDVKLGMEMINHYIALFRANGFPVIRVYHKDLKEGPATDSEAFEFPKTTVIEPEDPKIIKNFSSAFKKTDLDRLLKEKGCNTLFLCGLSAVGCVLATYHSAMDLEYNTFMLKDALISHNAKFTGYIQEICRTIDYWSLKLLLENICR